MLYFIIWLFLLLIEISKKIIFIEVFGVNEILIEFKGVKENRWGLCFGENRKERVRDIFVRTIERKKSFERKGRKPRAREKNQGRV